jgi:hypothetical protein
MYLFDTVRFGVRRMLKQKHLEIYVYVSEWCLWLGQM